VRFSAVRREMIAPFAIAIGVTASLIHEPSLMTHVQLIFATILGLTLKSANGPRAPFILGFVVGDLLETSSYQTAVIWGWSAALRPMTIVLALALVGWVAYLLMRRRKSHAVLADRPRRSGAVLAIVVFAIAALAELHADLADCLPVFVVCAAGLTLSAVILLRPGSRTVPQPNGSSLRYGWLVGGFLAANPLISLTASSAVFLTLMLHTLRLRILYVAAAVLIFGALQFLLLSLVFDIGIERDILGRGLWWVLGR
jgi:hypothetical protein